MLIQELQDETDFVQYGQEDSTEYNWINRIQPQSSAWLEHPTKNETGLYKFSSIEFNLDNRIGVVQRETYDLLSWLGDIGGLIDALKYAVQFIMAPYAAFSAKSTLLKSLFRMKPHYD